MLCRSLLSLVYLQAASFTSTDPTAGKIAVRPKDFIVFVNLVEFFRCVAWVIVVQCIRLLGYIILEDTRSCVEALLKPWLRSGLAEALVAFRPC